MTADIQGGPDGGSALDAFGIFKKSKPGDLALGKLTAEDFSDPEKPFLERAAEMIGDLWGMPYLNAGPRLRKDLKGAAKWVLQDQRGDIEAMERAFSVMMEDRFTRETCRKCHSPYAVARKMYAFAAKQGLEVKRKEDALNEWVSVAQAGRAAREIVDKTCPQCGEVYECAGAGEHRCDECNAVLKLESRNEPD